LNACKSNSANLLRVETHPALSIKFPHKGNYEFRFKEVDEAVANIAPIFKVNWQVEKVIGALMPNVDFF
jgi:hypothetical protein